MGIRRNTSDTLDTLDTEDTEEYGIGGAIRATGSTTRRSKGIQGDRIGQGNQSINQSMNQGREKERERDGQKERENGTRGKGECDIVRNLTPPR